MTAGQGAGAHRKGSNRELKVAKQLTKMFPGIEFHRTAYSGSTSNSMAQQGATGWSGDLFPDANNQLDGLFSIEVKDHSTFKLAQVFNHGAIFKSFLQQNVTDARRGSKNIPVLIMHSQQERDDIVTIPYQKDMYQHLVDNDFPSMITYGRYTDERTQVENNFDLIVTNLKGFGSPTANQLHKWYHKLDWDKYNKNNTMPDTEIDVDKLVDSIGNET